MSVLPKGLMHDFPQKLKFLPNLIFFEKGLGMMFDDVLDREKSFLDYKKVTLR